MTRSGMNVTATIKTNPRDAHMICLWKLLAALVSNVAL